MSRFPSPAHAERIDERIQKLNDGFERLGDEDTPFTLRKGGESLERAKQLHSEREASERKRYEESNEPVTRTLSEWRADMIGLDFPFVDTIPIDEQRNRANQIAELAVEEGFVDRIDRDVDFRDETVRGKHWRGVGLIEISTDSEDFPGFREGGCPCARTGTCLLRGVGSGQWHRRATATLPTGDRKDTGAGNFRTTPWAIHRDGRSVQGLSTRERRGVSCCRVRLPDY